MPGLGRLASYVTCEVSRRVYRWSRSSWRIEQRIGRLRTQLSNLPRAGVGILLKDLDPRLDERIDRLRKADRELVIADFDQNGGISSRFGEIAGIPTIGRDDYMPRTGCAVVLVDLNGRLGVRKEFGSSRGRFVQELEALLHLESRACPVPRVMNVDWKEASLTMTFVPGDVVRELLASAGADIRDRDPEERYNRAIDKQRVRSGREFVPTVLSDRHVRSVAAGLDAIHAAGFVLEDVKFGNIILAARTGDPVFVDLERALPVGGLPPRLARHLRQVDLRKLRDHFGDAHARCDGE